MLVQSDNVREISTTEKRQPQMTSQRQQYQQYSDDWAYKDLKRDIEADGQRHVVEITDNALSDNRKLKRITRPVNQ